MLARPAVIIVTVLGLKKLNADDEATLSSPRNITEVDHQALDLDLDS